MREKVHAPRRHYRFHYPVGKKGTPTAGFIAHEFARILSTELLLLITASRARIIAHATHTCSRDLVHVHEAGHRGTSPPGSSASKKISLYEVPFAVVVAVIILVIVVGQLKLLTPLAQP